MKASERDDLLIRLDERSKNTWRTLEEQHEKIDKILDGQKVQNGSILRNTIWRKVIVGVGGTSLLGLAGWMIRLTFGG